MELDLEQLQQLIQLGELQLAIQLALLQQPHQLAHQPMNILQHIP